MTLKTFTATYTIPDMEPEAWCFRCQAEDAEHAEEQCRDAEPRATILAIHQTIFTVTESWSDGQRAHGAWETLDAAKAFCKALITELTPKHAAVLMERVDRISETDVLGGFHNKVGDTDYFSTTLVIDAVPLHRKNAPQALENALVGQ
jgi:hypothetical protein